MAPSQKPININITSNGEELEVLNEYNEFREYIVKIIFFCKMILS